MIDIHCHILPGLDDGPNQVEESLIMLEKAVEEGINTIVVTPHHNNAFKPSIEQIIKGRDKLQEIIYDKNIPISLILGQEIRIYGELLEDYINGKLFSVKKDSRYLLIEFDSSDIPKYSERLFYDMQCKGLIPIIVHPERNKKILKHPEILYKFIQNGALSQITASSITGQFGKKVQKFSFQLLKANLAHLVAGDAHDVSFRSFRMKAAFQLVEKKLGGDYVQLLNSNAESVIANELVTVSEPTEIKETRFLRALHL